MLLVGDFIVWDGPENTWSYDVVSYRLFCASSLNGTCDLMVQALSILSDVLYGVSLTDLVLNLFQLIAKKSSKIFVANFFTQVEALADTHPRGVVTNCS